MTARRVVQVAGGLVAVVLSGYLIWFSITGLQDSPPDAWFYIVALALVPWILGIAVQLPDLVAPRTPDGRIQALFAPLPAALFSLGLFVCTIALAVAIGSWAWGVFVVACGVVLGLENFRSMRTFRSMVTQRPDEPRPAPQVRSVALVAGRMVLFLIALVIVIGSVGYVLLGRAGMLVAVALVVAGAVWSFVSVARGMRQSRAA